MCLSHVTTCLEQSLGSGAEGGRDVGWVKQEFGCQELLTACSAAALEPWGDCCAAPQRFHSMENRHGRVE